MSLADAKYGRLFQWFDQNRDGYVDQHDLDTLVSSWVLLADEGDEKNRNAIRKGFSFWSEILFDNKPGAKVNEEEFVHSMHTIVIRPENFDRAVMDLVKGVMGALDHDKNGSLSMEEYVHMYDAIGVPPVHSTEAFKRLDRDGSGEIDADELQMAIREYYLSHDPDAPGNWLLGPLEL